MSEEYQKITIQEYLEYQKLKQELQKTREQLENKGTKIKELTALIVNYMGMTKVEKEKYYEAVLTFSKQEKIEHSVRKILNALDNQLEQELKEKNKEIELLKNKVEKSRNLVFDIMRMDPSDWIYNNCERFLNET